MKIDLAAMRTLQAEKLISITPHPEFDLFIFNYTPVCQYRKAWDENTMMCRGIITDWEGNIIARPFPKFFNLAEHDEPESKLPKIDWRQSYTCTNKVDGSLGILYPAPDGPRIATRGSFTSEQAIRATKMFREKGYDKHPYASDLTYLFEIIYPENRIVVDYGEMENLVLLEVIDTNTGKSIDYHSTKKIAERIGCPVVDHMSLTVDTIKQLDHYFGEIYGGAEEGFVIRFDDGLRIKVKYAEYCRLHKLLTGINSKSIWEALRDKKGIDELLDRVPDEFYDWVTKVRDDLISQFHEIRWQCIEIINNGNEKWRQKEWAAYFLKEETKHLSAVLFSMLKKQYSDGHIWKMIKPVSSTPFKDDTDK